MAAIFQKQIVVLTGLVERSASRRAIAVAASAALHAGLLLALLWQPHAGIRGDMGRTYGAEGQGAGYDPVLAELISQHAARARHAPLATPPPAGGRAPGAPVPAETASEAQLASTIAVDTQGSAAQAIAGSGAVPGVPDGKDALLEQIARCLPPNERPRLKGASLRISVDGSGNLTAAPRLEVDVTQLTQQELRSANQVVQAAIQCGPYVVNKGEVAMFDIVPDFISIPLTAH